MPLTALVRVLQRNRTDRRFHILYETRDWLIGWRSPTVCKYTSWSPGKLVVSFQFKYEGLRTRGVNDVSSRARAKGEMRCDPPVHTGRKEQILPYYVFLFCSDLPWVGFIYI